MTIKKGLVKTCIYEYLDKHDLQNSRQVFEHMPEIYGYLRAHPRHSDLLPGKLTYQEFVHWAKVGFQRAMHSGNIFNKLKSQFNKL